MEQPPRPPPALSNAAPPPSPPTAQLHFERLARLRARAPRARFALAGGALAVELDVLPGGAIGSVVWAGAVVLAEFLARRGPALVAGRRALELGAGVGLVAVAAARLGAASVLATEAPGAADVLELLRRNAAAEAAAAAAAAAAVATDAQASLIKVAPLAWGAASWPGADSAAAAADLVLCADLVYEPASALLLAETLGLALTTPRAQCFMAYKERGAGAAFFGAVRALGLACEAVEASGEHTVFRIARREEPR